MKSRIHDLRRKYDISQKELAYKVGVTRQTINSLERNRNSSSLELAYRISKVFGLTVEEIFEDETP